MNLILAIFGDCIENASTRQHLHCRFFSWAVFAVVILDCLLMSTGHGQFVELQTELGRVRGVRMRTNYNNPAFAFLGIPYALPPIGERRFKV